MYIVAIPLSRRVELTNNSNSGQFLKFASRLIWELVSWFDCAYCQSTQRQSLRLIQLSLRTILLGLASQALWTSVLCAQNLYITEHNDLYGFADKFGTPVIPPKYGRVKPLTEGLAPVMVNGMVLYYPPGTKGVRWRFANVHSFSDDLAAVQEQADGEYGFFEFS